MAPEPVTTSVWLEQQLQRALARIDALAHEVEQLRESLRSEQAESIRFQEELALLNGRTSRHESNLDQIRGLQQQVATLEQRLEAEAALRRDRASAVGTEQQRDGELQQSLAQRLEHLDTDLARAAARLNAIEERQRQAMSDLTAAAHEDTSIEVRLDTLQRTIETVAANVRRDTAGQSAEAAAVPELRLALDAIEARTRALQTEQQRLDDALAHLASPADAQTLAADAVEQVRSLRERVEARLSALEEQSIEAGQSYAGTLEGRALLQRQLAAHDEQLRLLEARVAAQRESLIEHVRRATNAAEDAGRRQQLEIDQQTRAGRDLLTRLIERSDEGAQEQPL